MVGRRYDRRVFELNGLALEASGEGRCSLYICIRDHLDGGAIDWVWRGTDDQSGIGSISAVAASAPEEECDGD